ncbi:uncharacterized protein DUF2867 [Arcicella aurantiaca]|uniref:Uncharacterized protein DUF2867 n=1 Tax=Arcicella aurantiaca TaxID=591202 RepID=A0A316DHK5_9BACT|nr:DUF2867 domain-containing protein [Arcicella aurantiaca]PWK17624.1 uncharacterized protein DUF2867 [Arcicella aurantiaca]
MKISSCSIPNKSLLLKVFPKIDYADSYSVNLPDSLKINARDATRTFFECSPDWVIYLMKLRDKLVGIVGLKTHKNPTEKPDFKKVQFEVGEKYGLFEITNHVDGEIIMGADDKHLNFRVSIMINENSNLSQQLIVSTAVVIHNKFGTGYFKIIAPFHQIVVKSFIKKMAILLIK